MTDFYVKIATKIAYFAVLLLHLHSEKNQATGVLLKITPTAFKLTNYF